MLERVGVFFVLWGLLSPLVMCQSFMSARDDENGDLTLLQALSPLLFVIAAAFMISLLFAVKFVTPYQVDSVAMICAYVLVLGADFYVCMCSASALPKRNGRCGHSSSLRSVVTDGVL